MKRVLCYGDSNTYGQTAYGGRLNDEDQWPNRLQSLLSDYKVVQEGLGGRVAGNFESHRPYRNGQLGYEVIARSAFPVNIVVIALGTNDLKRNYGRSAEQIVADLLWYVRKSLDIAKEHSQKVPKVLYILPANFIASDYFPGDDELWQQVIKRMKQSKSEYIELDHLKLCKDGVHYSVDDHKVVAARVYEEIKEISAIGDG